MMRLDDVAGADDDRALDDVLELADVARPAVSFERANRVLTQMQILPALVGRMALHEVAGEDRNVPLSLAERRKLEPRQVQSVEETGPKIILGNGRPPVP